MSAFSDILDVIIGRAPKLREAGVLRVNIDGMAFDLAPSEQAAEDDDGTRSSDEEADPFEDPATYGGRPPPGYRRREREERS